MGQSKQQEWKVNGKNKTKSGYWRKQYAISKDKVFTKLGDKCIECGFADKRALHIDHINNDGYEHRKKNTSATQRLRDVINDKDEKYQILCANCNFIKKHETNEVKYMLRRAGL